MAAPPKPKYLFEKKPQSREESKKALEPIFDILMTVATSPLSLRNAAALAASAPAMAQAAFVTPSKTANPKSLRKFADATLEHLPNPTNLTFDDIQQSLHALYRKSPEGAAILERTGIPDLPVIMDEAMTPTSRGALIRDPSGAAKEIRINAFPMAGEFAPSQTLIHEVQHLIDTTQGRTAGTNLSASAPYKGALQAEDISANLDPAGTIDKDTLEQIMNQAELDVYLRNAGENRARIDAAQFPQFENFATWFIDPLTNLFKTGR